MDEPLAAQLSEIYTDPVARHGVGSWQQLVVTRAVERADGAGGLGLALASGALVLLQIVMLDAAATAARYPPCATNLQCAEQYYCATSPDDQVSGRCRTCSDSDHSVGTAGHHVAADFNLTAFCASDQADANACAACFDSDGTPFTLDSHGVVQGHVDAMQRGSWATLSVAGSLVALSLADHVRDIGLCGLLLAGAGSGEDGGATLPPLRRVTCIALRVLGQLRRFALLPMAASSYMHLVRYRGGDAINVCLSSVIVLFVLNIDAALFSSRWISSPLPAQAGGQQHEAQRQEEEDGSSSGGGGAAAQTAAAAKDEQELRPLDVSHSVHVLLLACAIPSVVFSGHATSYPMLAFCLGGWCDVALEPGLSVAVRVRGALFTLVKGVGGLIIFSMCDSFDRGELPH
jgi:hypothetical protein